MKIIKGFRFILEINSKENEKFSVFRVSDILYYNSSLRDQELELFEHTPYEDGDKFNSGERKIEIRINSEEERYQLSYLFIKEGFKIRNQEIDWDTGHLTKRVYVTENNFDKNSDPCFYKRCLGPHYNRFFLYLRKKDVLKFMTFLGVLSKLYGYKTIYQDIRQSRNAYSCCDENSYNYNIKYKLK